MQTPSHFVHKDTTTCASFVGQFSLSTATSVSAVCTCSLPGSCGDASDHMTLTSPTQPGGRLIPREGGGASSFCHSTQIKILTSARLRSSLESAPSAHKTTGPHQRGFAPKGPAREGTASADEDAGCARLPPHDDPGCCPDSVQKPDFPKILPFAAPREKFLLNSGVWPSFWPEG